MTSTLMLRSIICQRGVAELGIDVGDGVAHDADLEAADVGVERGVEDALLRDLAREHDLLDVALAQEVVERGAVERAVADLLQEVGVVRGHDRLDEIRPLPVQRLVDQVVAGGAEVLVVVVDVDEVVALGLGDHPGERRDDGLDVAREHVGVLVVVRIEHVDDEQCAAGHANDYP